MQDALYQSIAAVLDRIPIDTGGGCSLEKACLLGRLIRDDDLKCSVDIGVYRGRSLLPQAVAHKRYTGGLAWGVDPWDMSYALQAEVPEQVRRHVQDWSETTDLGQAYREVVASIHEFGLDSHCKLLRQPSTEAGRWFFEQQVWFDLVHIDGNHDNARVRSDIDLYLPRLRSGGYLVLDDISWGSIRPLYDELKPRLNVIYERIDESNDFAVLWNSRAWLGAQRRRLRQLASEFSGAASRIARRLPARLFTP